MEVILRQSVEKLGNPGDVVKVSNGFARNYLLPRGVAVDATEGNLKRIEAQRQRLEAAENERREQAQALAPTFEQVSLTFSARVGEEGKLFGSVTSARHRPAARGAGPQDREAADRPARADQGARRLPRADPPARRREARDQGLGDQAVMAEQVESRSRERNLLTANSDSPPGAVGAG